MHIFLINQWLDHIYLGFLCHKVVFPQSKRSPHSVVYLASILRAKTLAYNCNWLPSKLVPSKLMKYGKSNKTTLCASFIRYLSFPCSFCKNLILWLIANYQINKTQYMGLLNSNTQRKLIYPNGTNPGFRLNCMMLPTVWRYLDL